MKTKSIFASKTAALSFVTALAGVVGFFVPSVSEWTTANSSEILSLLGLIAMGLRVITQDKVILFRKKKP